MDFKHFSISDVGRVRKANEDNCGDRMTANGYVFVVCDGMGGHVGGATASKIAVESILNFFENPVQNIYVGINDAFKFANNQVYAAAQQDPSLKGMGTTGTVLIMNNEACYIGHVGDSRIYLKSDGKLNRLTKDHSFVQTLVDQGIINDDDAEKHPKKNQILEALGIKPDVNPGVCEAPIQPKPGDCFLLCSDGLNGMIRDPEIDSLIDPENVEASCGSLIAAANAAGGTDNITATLVTITESPHATSVFKHFNPVPVQTDTVVETIVEEPVTEGRKSKIILWGGIGIAALVVTLFLVFGLPGLMNNEESDPKDNPTPPVSAEQDSLCDSLDSLYNAFISDEGAKLFEDGESVYRLDIVNGKYQKLKDPDWLDRWGEKNMDTRYTEISDVFKDCEEIYETLPKETEATKKKREAAQATKLRDPKPEPEDKEKPKDDNPFGEGLEGGGNGSGSGTVLGPGNPEGGSSEGADGEDDKETTEPTVVKDDGDGQN